MPRVMNPKLTPEVEQTRQPEVIGEQMPEVELTPETMPAPIPTAAVERIVREVERVIVEVPLCTNPPGLDGVPSFQQSRVSFTLVKSRSRTGRELLHRLWWALREIDARLANGRKVFNRQDAVVWLIEQLGNAT